MTNTINNHDNLRRGFRRLRRLNVRLREMQELVATMIDEEEVDDS